MPFEVGYVSQDLFFPMRVKQLVAAKNGSFRLGADVTTLIARVEQPSDLPLVLLDLTLPQLDVVAAARELRNAFPNAKIIGYGPHVDTQLLAAAADAIDEVMPRSKYDHVVGELIEHAANQST
jgi:CheY-like chemotaxis protein